MIELAILGILLAAAVSAVNLSTIRRVRDMPALTMVALACFPVTFVLLIFLLGCLRTESGATPAVLRAQFFGALAVTVLGVALNAAALLLEQDRHVSRLVGANVSCWLLIGGSTSFALWTALQIASGAA